MKFGALFGAVAVAALVAWMLTTDAAWQVLDLIGNAGWPGLTAVVLFHLSQLLFSGAGWRALAYFGTPRPRLGLFVTARWIREAVNNLLPVAQVGGEFVGARLLLRWGVKLNMAVASTVSDLTVEFVTQLAFTLIGLCLLLLTVGYGPVARAVTIVLIVAIAIAAAFAAAQDAGLAHLVEAAMMRLGRTFGWTGFTEVAGLHETLIAIYRARARLMRASAHHLVSWLLGGVEVYLALYVLGHLVELSSALVIESLGQAFKALGFAVPGALGVQEGGYILVCGLYGLSPELAVALSLVKRLREIALGLPALATWQWLEARKPTKPPLPCPGTVP
jgi:putative membrane protein